MNRLIERMNRLVAEGERGLSPYVTAGDGGLETTLATLHALERAGAVCVELGLPFSDPIADGPVLQAAAQRSLERGTSFDSTLEMVTQFRTGGGRMPILLFGYANPFVRRGLGVAAARAAEAGVDGLLIPDVPLEEAGPVSAAAKEAGLAWVPFVAPTSSDERIARVARTARGFLYAIARVGVTGRATELDPGTLGFIDRVRQASECPLALGFGIRTAEQVAAVTQQADLAVVGSALVATMHQAYIGCEDPSQAPSASAQAAAQYLENLAVGLPGA